MIDEPLNIAKILDADTNGWMPIETAPLDGTKVDLWAKLKGTEAYERIADCSFEPMLDWCGNELTDWCGLYRGLGRSYEKPTHWQPLPKPPVSPSQPTSSLSEKTSAAHSPSAAEGQSTGDA